jgi:hypothetical protein
MLEVMDENEEGMPSSSLMHADVDSELEEQHTGLSLNDTRKSLQKTVKNAEHSSGDVASITGHFAHATDELMKNFPDWDDFSTRQPDNEEDEIKGLMTTNARDSYAVDRFVFIFEQHLKSGRIHAFQHPSFKTVDYDTEFRKEVAARYSKIVQQLKVVSPLVSDFIVFVRDRVKTVQEEKARLAKENKKSVVDHVTGIFGHVGKAIASVANGSPEAKDGKPNSNNKTKKRNSKNKTKTRAMIGGVEYMCACCSKQLQSHIVQL